MKSTSGTIWSTHSKWRECDFNAFFGSHMNQQTLFVYYKVPQTQHAQWIPIVERMQQSLLQKTPMGLKCSLLKRPEVSAEGLETWMEVYEHAKGVDQTMVELINEEVKLAGLPFKRASEFFIPLGR